MMPPRRAAMRAILRGMLLIARGRAEGLNCFGDTPRAFLASLCPGLGFTIGAMVQGLGDGLGARAFAEILPALCALLAPPVISYEMARFWGRDAFWGRYVVAFEWCQWLLPAIGVVLAAGLTAAHVAGLSGAGNAGPGLVGQGGIGIVLVCLACYALWMNWFIARHALALTVGRAAGFVAAVNLGTMVLAFGPTVLGASLG